MAGEYINYEVFNQGLNYADTNGTRIDILSQAVTNYSQRGLYTLGYKSGISSGVVQDGTIDGRRLLIPAITDGLITGTGIATHWALSNGASVLIACGPLAAGGQVYTNGIFTLGPTEIIIRSATIT